MTDEQKTQVDNTAPPLQPSQANDADMPGGDDTVVDGTLHDARKLPPVEGAELQEGQVLGKVRILREVGRGGMGAVYLGTHTTLDVKVAVKVLPPQIAAKHEQFAERFMREARLAAKINHPNIMGVLDADYDAETELYYIVLEFVGGGSVRDLMDKGPMSEVQTIDIGISVAEALAHAADFNIIHRDIKPDNIMLTDKGKVKLADMGIAKQRTEEDQSITMSSAMMGTPAYISPEQAMDAKNADARADIYSLGASMYHMLIGAPPYEGETTYAVLTKLATEPTPDPRLRRPDLSQEVTDIIMRMMDKDMENRPQTAKDLVEELTQVRSRIATSATAVAEGGQIRLTDVPTTPHGTPTQGVVGTDPGIATAVAGTAATAPATAAPTSPAGASAPNTAFAPAAPSSNTGLYVALAACILVIGAVAIILALNGGGKPTTPTQPTPSTPSTPPTGDNGTSTTASQQTDPGLVAAVTPQNGSPARSGTGPETGGETGTADTIARTPGTEPTPIPEVPADEELIEQAIAFSGRTAADAAEAGLADFKGSKAPQWPAQGEARLVGVATTEENAREAAYRKAVTTILEQVVVEEEMQKDNPVINKIVDNAGDYVRKGTEYGTGEADGKHYVALGLSPRAGKLGKDLYLGDVPLKNLYDLIGQPAVGVNMPEVFDMKDGGEKESRVRRAQRAIEKALRAEGVATVDVTGYEKDKQLEYCDILVSGTSLATLRGSAALPGGTKPVHVFNAEMELGIQLASTRRQIYNEILTFKPKGMDEVKTYGNFDSDEAAKATIEALVAKEMPGIIKSMTDEWVKLTGEVDYWVGVSGLTGGQDVLDVKKNLADIEGVTKVVPRYYKDGTQYVGIEFADTSEKLVEAFIGTGRYNLAEQRGAMLIFKVVK